jgi:methylated-DNA-[protein]-cysteine S-methyltransferase
MPVLTIPSPVGRLTLVDQDDALVAIHWGGGAEDTAPTALLREAARQLAAYFAGRLTGFDLTLAPPGSPFEQAVWAAMQTIPYGETRYYGDLARDIGCPSPRAIGRACGSNRIPIIMPCHRVLARGGLGGYSGDGGLATKKTLLAIEGAMAAEMPLFTAGRRRSLVTAPAAAAIVAPR